MDAKTERKFTMSNAAEMTSLTRNALGDWVNREERRSGSRMAAYETVAATIGASPSWIRNFLSQSVKAKQPDWTVGWNILGAYSRICERIEREAETEMARTRALKRQIDAAAESNRQMATRAQETQAARTDTQSNE